MAEVITDYPVERDGLLYLMSEHCKPKGWRVDLLVEKLSEERLLLCSCCNGLLRDACICNGAFMCQVCIPEGMAWQPVDMNRQIVNEKMIHCPLKWKGCGWSDTVNLAVPHLEDCIYLMEACPLGCVSLEGERKGKVVTMERIHIPEHVRDSCPQREVVCEFCGREVKASEMNPHLKECLEFVLHCPNHCSREGGEGMREVKRKDIPFHLDNDCPLQKVQCAYRDQGCREEMERGHTYIHEKEFLHIHFKLSMTEMKQKQNESTLRLQHELDIANEKIADQEIQISGMNAAITKSNAVIKIFEKQITDKDDRLQSLSDIMFSFLQSRIPIGTLEWNVKGVRQNILNKEMTFSEPFYVGLYKCRGSLEWNRNNTGNVGVFIHIMKGEFDDKLHWPIRYKFICVLINQVNKENNLVKSENVTNNDLERLPNCFRKPTGFRNAGFGHTNFISNTDIFEKKYSIQDYIDLHISVQVIPSL